MLFLKPGVLLTDLQPQTVLAIVVVDQCYASTNRDLVITAIDDSKHMEGSLHYKGLAFDCRTKTAGITQEQASAIAANIRSRLGRDFDVVVESDHIHIEYDPKPKPPKLDSV